MRVKRAGVPSFASTQRDEVLRLLREAGPIGVSRAFLIFDLHLTQCGTRIFELEQAGYTIEHRSVPGETYVRYVLRAEPSTPKRLPSYAERTRQLEERALPLFSGVR